MAIARFPIEATRALVSLKPLAFAICIVGRGILTSPGVKIYFGKRGKSTRFFALVRFVKRLRRSQRFVAGQTAVFPKLPFRFCSNVLNSTPLRCWARRSAFSSDERGKTKPATHPQRFWKIVLVPSPKFPNISQRAVFSRALGDLK